jgi:ketosteroid isomerase-like protein
MRGCSATPAVPLAVCTAPLGVWRPLVLLIAALALGEPAGAQTPGYPPIDPRKLLLEYQAEVLERINEVDAAWGHAWSNDRIDDLLELYWDDAVLLPPDRPPLRGRERIRSYFEEVLPVQGNAEAFMLDFDASGGMSQVFGNYMIGIQAGPDAGTQLTGSLVTVYMQRGRTWKIRSQVFVEGRGG